MAAAAADAAAVAQGGGAQEGGAQDAHTTAAIAPAPVVGNFWERWFALKMSPGLDRGLLATLPPLLRGAPPRECAVVACGRDDDDDWVQARSCRVEGPGCMYHRKCLDRQVRGARRGRM